MGVRVEYFRGELVGELIFIQEVLSPDFRRRGLFKCRCEKVFETRIDASRGWEPADVLIKTKFSGRQSREQLKLKLTKNGQI